MIGEVVVGVSAAVRVKAQRAKLALNVGHCSGAAVVKGCRAAVACHGVGQVVALVQILSRRKVGYHAGVGYQARHIQSHKRGRRYFGGVVGAVDGDSQGLDVESITAVLNHEVEGFAERFGRAVVIETKALNSRIGVVKGIAIGSIGRYGQGSVCSRHGTHTRGGGHSCALHRLCKSHRGLSHKTAQLPR